MTTFTITVQDQAVMQALAKLSARVGNMAPYLQALGEDIVERSKARFDSSSGPDGQAWKGYSPVTLGLMRTRRGGGSRKLLVDTGALQRQIVATVQGTNALRVSAAQQYAAIHQFGGMAGRGRRVKIPARPFLPVRADGSLHPQEQALVLATLQEFLLDGV
jgi:phage virion morphogenesis protein